MNPTSEPNPLILSRQASLRLPSLRRPLLIVLACAAATLAGCKKKPDALPPVGSMAPTATATVTSPPTASLTADPLAIELGSTVVLNWRTTNATVVTIDGIGPVPINGTQTVSPSNSTNFHLVAKGDGGMTEANVRVTVRAAVTDVPGTTKFGPSSSKITPAQFSAAVQDMYFDYDSYELRPDAQAIAAQSASFLVQHPDIHILIGGYADERGSAEYNLALGENRANAAKTGLVNAGVAPARIRVISYGKEKQFCTEATETCWQENRRAQFTMDQ
jgi:peptidoglycan-associated lipoprotein